MFRVRAVATAALVALATGLPMLDARAATPTPARSRSTSAR